MAPLARIHTVSRYLDRALSTQPAPIVDDGSKHMVWRHLALPHRSVAQGALHLGGAPQALKDAFSAEGVLTRQRVRVCEDVAAQAALEVFLQTI